MLVGMLLGCNDEIKLGLRLGFKLGRALGVMVGLDEGLSDGADDGASHDGNTITASNQSPTNDNNSSFGSVTSFDSANNMVP